MEQTMAKTIFEELSGKVIISSCARLIRRRRTADRHMGQQHLEHLKQYRRVTYTNLFTSGRLNTYLVDIDRQAQERFERLIEGMKQAQGGRKCFRMDRKNYQTWLSKFNSARLLDTDTEQLNHYSMNGNRNGYRFMQ